MLKSLLIILLIFIIELPILMSYKYYQNSKQKIELSEVEESSSEDDENNILPVMDDFYLTKSFFSFISPSLLVNLSKRIDFNALTLKPTILIDSPPPKAF